MYIIYIRPSFWTNFNVSRSLFGLSLGALGTRHANSIASRVSRYHDIESSSITITIPMLKTKQCRLVRVGSGRSTACVWPGGLAILVGPHPMLADYLEAHTGSPIASKAEKSAE